MMHYVYLWKDPKTEMPVYVGKGQGDRVWDHIEKRPSKRSGGYHCTNLLHKRFHNYVCIPHIIVVNATETSELERFLIKLIGRKDLGTGPLLNLTDGGEGVRGYRWTEQHRLNHGASQRIAASRPEVRAKKSISIKAAMAQPERRKKLRENAKAIQGSPEAKARKQAQMRSFWSDPEKRAQRSRSLKAAWNRRKLKSTDQINIRLNGL